MTQTLKEQARSSLEDSAEALLGLCKENSYYLDLLETVVRAWRSVARPCNY